DNADFLTASYIYDGDNVSILGQTNGVPDKPLPAMMRAASAVFFDDRGQMYRTIRYTIDPANPVLDTSKGLATDVWHDNRGQVIKVRAVGGLVTKTRYDGAGRTIGEAQTDGGGDAAPGAQDATNSAGTLTDDIV